MRTALNERTYKGLLCLRISPNARGARVWITGSIGAHPNVSSLPFWGSPLLLSHSAQTTCSSSVLSCGSGADPLENPQSPGLPCLKEEKIKSQSKGRWLNPNKVIGFEMLLTWHQTGITTSWAWTITVNSVKDNEWPEAPISGMSNRKTSFTSYHSLWATLLFSTAMNHICVKPSTPK